MSRVSRRSPTLPAYVWDCVAMFNLALCVRSFCRWLACIVSVFAAQKLQTEGSGLGSCSLDFLYEKKFLSSLIYHVVLPHLRDVWKCIHITLVWIAKIRWLQRNKHCAWTINLRSGAQASQQIHKINLKNRFIRSVVLQNEGDPSVSSVFLRCYSCHDERVRNSDSIREKRDRDRQRQKAGCRRRVRESGRPHMERKSANLDIMYN